MHGPIPHPGSVEGQRDEQQPVQDHAQTGVIQNREHLSQRQDTQVRQGDDSIGPLFLALPQQQREHTHPDGPMLFTFNQSARRR